MTITMNPAQEIYVIPCSSGYTCLGFEVAARRRRDYLAWLRLPCPPMENGTVEAYEAYEAAYAMAQDRFMRTGERCPVELTPALIGLEGKRVEVTTPDGTKTRFYVGKSNGWSPCHLEIARRGSSGGPAVYIPQGAKIRVVAQKPRG